MKKLFIKYFDDSRFIHTVIAILILIDGIILIHPMFMKLDTYIHHNDYIDGWVNFFGIINFLYIPRLLMGVMLLTLVVPIFIGVRIGWLFSIIILSIITLIYLILDKGSLAIGIYSFMLLLFLIINWRKFNRHSLSAAGFVSFVSLTILLGVSIFGTLYLGDHFQPHVKDFSTALYFALVCITTVGFGDIVPISIEARLFTVSIIILGVTIFTTVALYILGTLAKDTSEIVKQRIFRMKDHYIIIGYSPLSILTYRGLKKRDLNIIVLCTEEEKKKYPNTATVITTSYINKESLDKVNIKSAKGFFVLGNSDAENILVVLAAKEIINNNVKSIVIVNDDKNYENMKLLHTDLSISLTSLGSEILIKMLFGENIDNKIIEDMLFPNNILKD